MQPSPRPHASTVSRARTFLFSTEGARGLLLGTLLSVLVSVPPSAAAQSPDMGTTTQQPPGTQPPGTQPPGTQPSGTQPPGTQPAGTKPAAAPQTTDKKEPPPACGTEAFWNKRAQELQLELSANTNVRDAVLAADSTRSLPQHNAYFEQEWLPGGGIARLIVDASLDLGSPDKSPCVFGFWLRPGTPLRRQPVHWIDAPTKQAASGEARTELRLLASFGGYKDSLTSPMQSAFLIVVGYSPEGKLLFTYNSRRGTAEGTPEIKQVAPQEAAAAPLLIPGHAVTLMSRQFARIVALIAVLVLYLLVAIATKPGEGGDAAAAGPKAAGPRGKRHRLWQMLNPIRISAGYKGEPSMSQLQLFSFTLLLGGMLLYLWAWTGALSEMSKDLLILLGVSVTSTVAAKGAAQNKTEEEDKTRSFFIEQGWFEGRSPSVAEPTLRALFGSDGQLDIYKFQMAVFSVITAGYIIMAGTNGLGQISIPEEILYLMGLSQFAYIGGKLVTKRNVQLDTLTEQLKAKRKLYLEKQAQRAEKSDKPEAAGEIKQLDAELLRIQKEYASIAREAAKEFRAAYRTPVDLATAEKIH